MTDENDGDTLFCIVESTDSPFPKTFKFGTDVDALVKWAKQIQAKTLPPIVPEDAVPQEEQTISFGSLMSRISESGHQQYDLTLLLSQVRTVFPSTMIKGGDNRRPLQWGS